MKYITVLLFMILTNVCKADTFTVGVIDTGFDFDSTWPNNEQYKPKFCNKNTHKDFSGRGIKDTFGHGTHIAGLIAYNAKDTDYCLTIVKFNENAASVIKALEYLISLKVKIINISLGGEIYYKKECELITKALNKGIVIVASAGNNNNNLNKVKYYPAMCDNRVIVVQNSKNERELASTSNYGNNSNFYKENGVDVYSIFPNNKTIRLTGTSQAAAIFTGKLIKELQKEAK